MPFFRLHGISARLTLLSLTFALPTAYLMWLLIGAQRIAIDFATLEVDGTRALAAIVPVQIAASRAVLGQQALTAAADLAREARSGLPADLDAGQAAAATTDAFAAAGPDPATAARARLRDLIVRVGDRSNLILDNVLETYYLTDVVLNRLPEVIDRVTDLAMAGTAEGRAAPAFLIAAGALGAAVDGMDASLTAAEQDNGDGAIKAALDTAYQPVRGALGRFLDGIARDGANPAASGQLVSDLGGFDTRAVGELRRLLGDRVATLVWARRGHVALAGLLYLVSLLAVLWTMHRGVTRPIAVLAAVTERLTHGELTAEVPVTAARDEVGALTRALAVFRDGMVEAARLTAERDAEHRAATTEKRHALIAMADRIEAESGAAMAAVSVRTAAISIIAEDMSTSAGLAGQSARTASTAAARALATAQTVASAAEQLSASIHEIGGQVGQSTVVVGRAVTAGGETRATIEALNEQVGRIGAVAEMIGEIAARTNLLALNATIEAARAGDAGRGFAIVAAEVKQLATQTAHSTAEIARHIGDVRTATGASVASVGRIETTIAEISAIAGSIAAAVEQQGAATAEIARSVGQTAAAVEEMNRCIDEVSGMAATTGQRSGEVREGTAQLNDMIADLKQTMVRVVRTSTAEADRRQAPRQAIDRGCRIEAGGRPPLNCRVTDLSPGGASIKGVSGLGFGMTGTLTVDGIGMRLPFAVRAAEAEWVHVAFDGLAAAEAERLSRLLDETPARAAA